ncbi:MAG: hypothetical protein ABW141_20185 [Candidatus Thiodiazotropha endolucinida]
MYRCKMLAVALVTLAFSGLAESDGIDGFNFTPLDASANSADWKPASPWKVPKGFKQRVVSDETDLNIYDGGRNDWHDMNTVNETGP